MKTLLFITTLCLSVLTNAQEKEFRISTSKSYVEWEGSKTFEMGKHSGTVNIKSGAMKLKEFKIVGGEFIIDMNTIENTDGRYNAMLVDHLKNDDFFSVAKFPEAKLSITQVYYKDNVNVEVFADLTIKGITNPIKFKGKLDFRKDGIKLHTEFSIDRTLWGVDYKSKGLFGAVKDGIISDAIKFKVAIIWFQDMC
ncbi:YceI family protein [Seonamhaeicola marinus]|uniref:YceI family protein n=1 Tax=Seonamhaeicola marinus TaxID=1912246 RepID=A0A5D0HRL9_9FLAO|nr:YceI family protein [Seonamhaeicola marinus]TYA74013.1 YceI family protein [Seonamhaeicola marinus]